MCNVIGQLMIAMVIVVLLVGRYAPIGMCYVLFCGLCSIAAIDPYFLKF
jgi:hypothetical protein